MLMQGEHELDKRLSAATRVMSVCPAGAAGLTSMGHVPSRP